MAEVGNFLVKAEGCGFRFGGGGVFEGNCTNTYFETYLPQTSPKIRDWVPLRKWKEKKYIIIYYITTSTLTPRQGRTLTTHEDQTLQEAGLSGDQKKRNQGGHLEVV